MQSTAAICKPVGFHVADSLGDTWRLGLKISRFGWFGCSRSFIETGPGKAVIFILDFLIWAKTVILLGAFVILDDVYQVLHLGFFLLCGMVVGKQLCSLLGFEHGS